jgi:hypothetical protein
MLVEQGFISDASTESFLTSLSVCGRKCEEMLPEVRLLMGTIFLSTSGEEFVVVLV